MFGFVERFRDVSGEHGVNCAYDNQHDRVAERYDVRDVNERFAHQYVRFSAWVVVDGLGWADQHPYAVDEHLKCRRDIRRRLNGSAQTRQVIDRRPSKKMPRVYLPSSYKRTF